jgi:hypothetical protein
MQRLSIGERGALARVVHLDSLSGRIGIAETPAFVTTWVNG